MSNYSTTISYTSTIDPDVTVVLHSPSYGRRVELDQNLAKFRQQIREIGKQRADLDKRIDAAGRTAFDRQKARDLSELRTKLMTAPEDEKPSIQTLLDETQRSVFDIPGEFLSEMQDMNVESSRSTALEYNPVLIRWGVKEVNGLEIDGKPATADDLISVAPVELVHEAVERIEAAKGMTPEQLKNSQWPSIFSVPVDGKTNDTIAEPVSATNSSDPETVESLITVPATS